MSRTPISNPARFNFDGFVERVLSREGHFLEIGHAFERECAQAEAAMSGRGGPQARADGGREYVARLKRVLFWFHHGALADHGQERETCRRLAERFVASGNLKPEALNIFRS